MESRLCVGTVHHARTRPVRHAFSYSLLMAYLDLSELDEVFRRRWFWSTRGPNIAWFRRGDHFGDAAEPLDETVRNLVESRLGRRPRGPVRLLTQLRQFGYVINPISVYFCFEPGRDVLDAIVLDAIVLEVTNTPWGERCLYVLDQRNGGTSGDPSVHFFEKEMHVSPFMEMEYDYSFAVSHDEEAISIHMENQNEERRPFTASLALRKKPITGQALAFCLCSYPFMTAKTALAIYFEAFRLWLKRVPFHSHPTKRRLQSEAHRP